MQRIKIPYGGLNAQQLEVLAVLAEEYSDGIAHITTRQDVQLHFVHIEDTPALMRRLAAAGITTREACGNTVRNVTACPIAGVCRTETFDVTPYAKALAYFLLGHPDTRTSAASLRWRFPAAAMKRAAWCDYMTLAPLRWSRTANVVLNSMSEEGSEPSPNRPSSSPEFLPEEELLPLAQSVARVFARLGEKKNRNTARLKFLISKLGLDEFKRLVAEERAQLTPDPRWTSYLPDVPTMSTSR